MSYLSSPRLHFSGFFQADVSTINNDVRYFDTARFKDQYQRPSSSGVKPNGSWHPEGTGVFRLVGCTITGGRLGKTTLTSSQQDPAIGMALEGSGERVAGKLVDLDPQQQAVSEIWGMALRLTDERNTAYFEGAYHPAAFINLWHRQQAASAPNDQTLAAVYQSVLKKVRWRRTRVSPLLQALREACPDRLLSICFNVYGYGRDPDIPRYTLGRVAGTIGPAAADEPRHFVLGRQMMPKMSNPVTPASGINSFQCQVDADDQSVTADFGNALPIVDATGVLSDVGDLALAVLKGTSVEEGATLGPEDVALLGTVPYRAAGWYERTAGVQTFDYADDPWIADHIATHPLVLVQVTGTGLYKLLVQESLGGLYVRADSYVCRLNPGEERTLKLYATRYGQRIAATIALQADNSSIGGAGTDQDIPGTIPEVGRPADALHYAPSIDAKADGVAPLTLTASPGGPGNPRGYIDGQVYGIGYQLQEPALPEGYNANAWNFISVLAFDAYPVPEAPTWHEHVKPILQQYGNLYPIMSRHLVDLSDYDAVVAHAAILKLAFSLPVHDPNYMPVTRDLSDGKRATLLKWLDDPLEGDESDAPAPASVVYEARNVPKLNLEPLQEGGKTAFILQLEARKKQGGSNDD